MKIECALRGPATTFGLLVLLVLPWTAACLPRALETTGERPDPARVQVRFLGVGGFSIRRGSDVVLAAPLYSSPGVGDLLAGTIPPNTGTLDQFFTLHELDEDAADIRAIVSGHGHYDHLMDVRYFLEKAPSARFYGNLTSRRILAGYGPAVSSRVVALNDPADNYVDFTYSHGPGQDGCVNLAGQPGRPRDVDGTGGRIRIRAFVSRHPPQLLNAVHFWPGCQGQDLSSPPLRSEDYKEGEVLTFLIDFMDGGKPAFRIYYQDAAGAKPDGWVPPAIIAERPVDLALLCVGNFDAVEHPEKILSEDLHARQVILHHWEDFFDPEHRSLTEIPGSDADEFYSAVLAEMGGQPGRVHILKPGVLLNFPR